MNFEETYKKYKDGTATDEEKAFVESEIEKSKRLLDLIDDKKEPVIEKAEKSVVKKARKKNLLRSTLRTVIISLAIVVVVAGAVLGGVFGTAATAAKNSLHPDVATKEQAVNLAKKYLVENGYKDAVIVDCDRDLEMRGGLKKSYYIYEIEVLLEFDDVDVIVNGKTGKVTIDY